ncbi:MAG TPA: hypothetical protein P5514_13335 [Bacteroidales bacterium]|nr:hypothetical protein [Bacteroidales bacterium]HRX97925.1 hypothetical protein [Bacteroidales bacterium]
MEENSFLYFISGFAGTIIVLFFLVTRVLVGKKPLIDLLNDYNQNPKFKALNFKIIDNKRLVGKIDQVGVELIPRLKEEGGMLFTLIIDLTSMPSFNNQRNLVFALGRMEFEQEDRKVTISNWEPEIFNYGDFEKVVGKIEELIYRIENKRNINLVTL